MLWTDEAVESLKRLALEGLSASVIAATIGAESRNAVIGKANRIGIRLGRASGPPGASAGRAPSALHLLAGNSQVFEREKRPAWPFRDAEVGEMRRLSFRDIRDFACRWPLGDPTSGDFSYCGLTAAKGRSYCAGHCRVAYRPPNARAIQSSGKGRRASARGSF